jgi:Ca-activated chloride channel homolog
MENQDKLYNKIQQAAKNAEANSFPGMEKVWARVEEKLDKKEDKKVIILWEKWAIAASLLLFVSIGYQFLKSDKEVIKNDNPIVIENKDTIQNVSPLNIEKTQEEVVVSTEVKSEKNSSAEPISKESILKNSIKKEQQVVSIFNDSLMKLKDLVALDEEKSKMISKEIPTNITTKKQIREKIITGIVMDSNGMPLPGATVLVKGTSKIVSADFDGKFSVNASAGETLVFYFIGYKASLINVKASNHIDAFLEEDSQLSEVVVTGSAIKKEKKALGYSVPIISSSDYSPQSTNYTRKTVNYIAPEFNNQQTKVYNDSVQKIKNNNTPQDESYESFEENAFESPTTAPLSTFSIDVDNASYTNIRRFINNGQTVPKDAVRVEEMINFFKYNYKEPTNEHPFSIHTEYSDCAWNSNHKVLKVGLQGRNIPTDNLPASNLVFLIDVSGSMNDQNKLPLLKQSMKILVEQLRKKDKVSIVVYAGAAGLVLPPTSGDDKTTIIDALEKLQAGGSTAGGAGIELAYKIAQENFVKNGNNRVILATDGDFNVGASSNKDMQTLIEEKRKSGVFLTCLGYGMGNYKDSKMETIANKGNGNYAYIDNIQEANRFLGKEFKGSMFAIAKDVKIQIEFNPQHVQAYRLIGYENRKLKDEDFVNDAIDAGELGSGHTVTALYEIIPTNVKSDFFKEPIELKYSKTENSSTTFGNELATIKFRYKKPDGEKSIEMVQIIENKSIPIENSSDDFKFSSAVAWFGLKLRDSKLVQNKNSEAIKTLAKKGLSNDSEGYKSEFIRLVEIVK